MRALLTGLLLASLGSLGPRPVSGAGVPAGAEGLATPAYGGPIHWLLVPIGLFSREPRALPNAIALDRDRGRTPLDFEVGDSGTALYLEISGRCRFERARIEFADGSCDSLDLGSRSRGSGRYLLESFDGMRGVRRLRIDARCESPIAYVGARLGRDAR